MELKFTKMHGCGNDYIYVNCFEQKVENIEKVAVKLSDRHKGIGADGVILICPSEIAHAKMRMFNLDGSEGKMCGNGIRCVAEYLFLNNMIESGNVANIETLAGVKTITRKEPGLLTVDMGAPILEPELVPVNGFTKPVVNELIEISGGGVKVTCLSMGNPHCVTFVGDTAHLNMPALGAQYANNKIFPEGVNAEFVKVIDDKHLVMRVWERGSGETLACGTGACASVVAACLCGHCKQNTDVDVELLGGTLTIRYTGETVFMTGNAVSVFDGVVTI